MNLKTMTTSSEEEDWTAPLRECLALPHAEETEEWVEAVESAVDDDPAPTEG